MNLPRLLLQLLLGKRLPTTSGTLEIDGIKGPVLIRRDRYSIPHIEAERDEDAWYGLGFCQGQDHAVQLEGLLRIVRGTMAEMTGPDALPMDRLSRRIGFRHAAEKQLQTIGDEERLYVEAYARGVSDGSTLGCRKLPHEFAFIRSRPTPFQAADVIAIGKFIGFTLASNWDSELVRLKILTEDGLKALKALDFAWPDWHFVTSPPGTLAGPALDRLAEDLTVFTANVGRGGASNNWAIAPSRTATGRPILANDPHLPPALPPYWYLAHVRTPSLAVAGATFIGTPVFIAGHNGTVAWGVTAGMIDNSDLFIEEIGPDGQSVREGDGFVPCEVRREVIKVKGRKAVEEDILVTPRGPIIGPALDGDIGAISLSATWLSDRPFKGFSQVHHAKNFEEFRSAWSGWRFAAFNMAYADTSGTIGWQLVGEAPKRRKGWGTVPLAGWDAETGWDADNVPFDELPHLSNPDTGYVATANNHPTQEGEGPFLGVDWLSGYRLSRIVEALDAKSDWDLASIQALQMDQKSIPWQEMRDAVLSTSTTTDEARKALTMLTAWDGVVAADSSAATVFEFFVAHMIRRMAAIKAPRASQWALGKGFASLIPHSSFGDRHVAHLVHLLREQPEEWLPQSWPEEIEDALAAVFRTLQGRYGSDTNRWAWGSVRKLTLRHPVGVRKPLDRLFNLGPFPWGGDINTVGQGASDPTDPTANPFFIASLRVVIDVGNWDESRYVLPGGQSGNPLSPHYDDLLPFWKRGEGVPIAWSPTEVDKATRSTLHLVPSP